MSSKIRWKPKKLKATSKQYKLFRFPFAGFERPLEEPHEPKGRFENLPALPYAYWLMLPTLSYQIELLKNGEYRHTFKPEQRYDK
jgi:hypothetical protein